MRDYLNPHRIYTDRIDNAPGNDSIRSRLPGISVRGGSISKDELRAYVDRAIEIHGREPTRMEIAIDGDFVDISYTFAQPFERIRRITGYLQKTTQWNSAKQHELSDRVKHGEVE